ncbi:MAG TPA: branched-chain amino acid ABC transporter permease, partial [Syntrophomonas sp.]|nr:branched-chain amino acid ABC transporter permease [Syntrophomonas sp.]
MESIFGFFSDPYINQILTLTGVYLITALGLHLITGLTGLFSFGHAGFMSIGAYTSAILSMQMGSPFFVSLLGGAMVAAFFGFLIGIPTLRLEGDYLAMVTIGFAEIIRVF